MEIGIGLGLGPDSISRYLDRAAKLGIDTVRVCGGDGCHTPLSHRSRKYCNKCATLIGNKRRAEYMRKRYAEDPTNSRNISKRAREKQRRAEACKIMYDAQKEVASDPEALLNDPEFTEAYVGFVCPVVKERIGATDAPPSANDGDDAGYTDGAERVPDSGSTEREEAV